MNQKSTNRWYDKNPELSEHIEKLRYIEIEKRERIISDIKELITDTDDELIDSHVMDFPLTTKRRWYDTDPYSWLVINALKYADKKLIDVVIGYLKEKT